MYVELLFNPLIELLDPKKKIENRKDAEDELTKALASGRIKYRSGVFTGRFSVKLSKAIMAMGGKWSKRKDGFVIKPAEIKKKDQARINKGVKAFDRKYDRIQKAIERFQADLPAEISKKVKSKQVFDKSIRTMDDLVSKAIKSVSVTPRLSEKTISDLARDWSESTEREIKSWSMHMTEDLQRKLTVDLRKNVQKHISSGGRFEDMLDTVMKTVGVTKRKAYFIARQETKLMLASLKGSRLTQAGAKRYRWKCVAGSAKHPVRPRHKALDGQIFAWSNPPRTSEDGEPARYNNPGEDYNCRCLAIPILEFEDE